MALKKHGRISDFCWPWKIGNHSLCPRIGSAGESYSPGAADDSTAKVELHLFQLACGLPHNLFVILSWRTLTTQSQQQLWLEVRCWPLTGAADCRGHREGHDPTAYDSVLETLRVCWETAARLGWGLAVLEEHPSIPPATARALTPALRGLSHKITFPFPDQMTLELTPHPYPYFPPPCRDKWLVVSKLLLCSSPVKSLMSIKLLLEKVFSKGNPSFSQKRAHCILAANCPAAFLLGRPSWDTAESQGTSQGLVKTGQCGVVSQTSGKFNGWWRVISSGWKWPSHTRIPVFSMERNKLLGLRLSDLFYHVF